MQRSIVKLILGILLASLFPLNAMQSGNSDTTVNIEEITLQDTYRLMDELEEELDALFDYYEKESSEEEEEGEVERKQKKQKKSEGTDGRRK